ncbi:hypothetical protein [Microvirga aerophila]|uniref:Uncharacterized protein n=1 Tax=Microvirga aerophila TaxID=670291 RepID=A0A512C452_9HYPH|nr:hypothetical protein [Microvirga aerophila]GEO18978.1 hypothetical protein MAE02_66740 [Microvirga aerophila]
MLCPQTDTIPHSRRPGRPATASAIIARCDALCFPGGVSSYIAPAARIRRIRACAVEQLGRHPPSKRSIEKFYEQRAVVASRWWRHKLLEVAFIRAFPGGVVSADTTIQSRNDRILDDGFAADQIQLPSPTTIRRFLKSRGTT